MPIIHGEWLLLLIALLPAIIASFIFKKESTGAWMAAIAVALFLSWPGLAITYLFFYFNKKRDGSQEDKR